MNDKSIFNSYSQIVFQVEKDIFTVNPDGTNLVKIWHPGADVDWSPNGKWIAFTVWDEDEGESSICIMRPDGTGAVRVAYHNESNPSNPVWSPDSNEIAYENYFYETQQYETWVINLNSGQTRPIAKTGYAYGDPKWLSTNEIAFTKDDDIFIINNNGVRRSEFLSNLLKISSYYFSYSRDASKIAFIKNYNIICIMDSDGSNYKEFDFQDLFISYVKWSPDNQFLMFVVKKSAGQSVEEIWAISIDGEYKWMIANSTEYSYGELDHIHSFSWSPFL